MILNWLVSALAIMLTAYILPRASVNFLSALFAAIVLGFLNTLIKPLLVLLTLPINILTLGLFTLVINGIIISLVSAITPGFKIEGFGNAILFALVLTVVNIIFGIFIK